jgi:poly(3-hydroxyalkanoate) synthetase
MTLSMDGSPAPTEGGSPAPAVVLGTHLAVSAARSLAELTSATGQAWARLGRPDPRPLRPLSDGSRWWGHMVGRRQPQWASPHEVVFSTPIARLRDFSQNTQDDVVPTLVLPPQAGHDSSIVDFSPKQSQMETIRAAGLTRAFSLDWVGATYETRTTTVDDYIAVIDRAIAHIGGPVNLIGDCQGGWLAAIYAALRPENINTLTLAGAPIDFHAGDAMIAASTRMLTGAWGMMPYQTAVALGGGNMPGRFVLGGFITMQPEAELGKQLQLLLNLDDDDHVDRYQRFEDWFKHTQDVPGAFYLWLVEHLFRNNELIRGQLRIGERRVDLADITCPLFLLAGATDHITPPPQLFAAADAVGTPPEQITCRTTKGGHLGLFMGREALRGHWAPLMAEVHGLSVDRTGNGRERAADEQNARAATKRGGPRVVPAP